MAQRASSGDTGAIRDIFGERGYLAVNQLGKAWGDRLAAGTIKPTRVRNILNAFQAIAETWDGADPDRQKAEIARLKPNLTYLAARQTDTRQKLHLTELAEFLGQGVDVVLAPTATEAEMKQRYRTLVDLVEAITAYHRLHS